MSYTTNGPIDLQAADISVSFRFVRRYWLWTWIKKLSTKDKGASYQSALKGARGRARQWLLSCRRPTVSLHGERAGGPAWRTHRWRSHPFLRLEFSLAGYEGSEFTLKLLGLKGGLISLLSISTRLKRRVKDMSCLPLGVYAVFGWLLAEGRIHFRSIKSVKATWNLSK